MSEQFFERVRAGWDAGYGTISADVVSTWLPVTPREVFATLTGRSESLDTQTYRDGVDFNIVREGQRFALKNVPRDYLPRPKDESFDGYHARMKGLLGETTTFQLLLWEPPSLQESLGRFLEGFEQSSGFVGANVSHALVLGDYGSGYHGVHVEPEDVFVFPIVGTKSLRMWTPEFACSNPELLSSADTGIPSYRDLVGSSTLLQADIGGCFFFRSHWAHVSESRGFHCSWVVKMKTGSLARTNLTQTIEHLLRVKASGEGGGAAYDSYRGSLQSLDDQLELLGKLLASGELRSAAVAAHVSALSVFGARPRPTRVVGRDLDDDDALERAPGTRLVPQSLDDEKIALGLGGCSITLPNADALMGLVSRLNGRDRLTRGQLREEFADAIEEATLEKLLQLFWRHGALDVDDGGSRV